MELQIRPMCIEERKYAYEQSSQLISQTGSIGRLRGDFGSGGMEFWTTWEDHRQDLKTDAFKAELDDVINALRSEEYGLFKDRRSMVSFARKEPDSTFSDSCDFVLWIGRKRLLKRKKLEEFLENAFSI